MVILSTVSSKMACSVAKASMKLLMGLSMLGCGNLTCKKEKGPKLGLMAQCTLVLFTKVNFTDMECTYKVTIVLTRVTG